MSDTRLLHIGRAGDRSVREARVGQLNSVEHDRREFHKALPVYFLFKTINGFLVLLGVPQNYANTSGLHFLLDDSTITMAETKDLRQNKRFITSHDVNGKEIFDNSIPEDVPYRRLPDGAHFGLCYATNQFPADLSSDKDVSFEFVHSPRTRDADSFFFFLNRSRLTRITLPIFPA